MWRLEGGAVVCFVGVACVSNDLLWRLEIWRCGGRSDVFAASEIAERSRRATSFVAFGFAMAASPSRVKSSTQRARSKTGEHGGTVMLRDSWLPPRAL